VVEEQGKTQHFTGGVIPFGQKVDSSRAVVAGYSLAMLKDYRYFTFEAGESSDFVVAGAYRFAVHPSVISL
jgi:hypothetical protein